MGSGSSRAAKARGRHRGLARGSGSSSAPAGQGQAGAARAAGGGGAWYCSSSCSRQSPVRPPSPPLGEPDSDSELLDRMLEECDDGRPEPPGRRPPRLDAGDFCSRPAGGGAGKKEDGIPREERVFLARSIQESNDFANPVPLRKPEMQAKVSYDYSEEELMAIIEQEYCR